MAVFPTEAAERLVEYNSDFYDANTNPYGFADGGHIPNFPAALQDTASVLAYIAATTQEVQDHAQEVVDNLALVIAARDLSMKWAANPEDVVVQGGLFSALHYARKAAASAIAAATFNPALFAQLAGATFTGLVSFFTGTAARAGINLGQRGTAPTAPANGDLWGLATGLWGTFGGVTRQFYDTTTLPAMTQAIAEAGADTVARSVSALTLRQAAIAADQKVLVHKLTAAQLNGQDTFLFDLPAEFSTFEVLIETVVTTALGNLTIRCGAVGGALDAGATDYIAQGVSVIGANNPASFQASGNAGGIGNTDSSGNTIVRMTIVDGSAGGFWKAFLNETGADSNGNIRTSIRTIRRSGVSGARKRIGILSSVPLQNFGSLKIYGVRN